MAKLARSSVVNGSVLVAGLSLMGAACASSAQPPGASSSSGDAATSTGTSTTTSTTTSTGTSTSAGGASSTAGAGASVTAGAVTTTGVASTTDGTTSGTTGVSTTVGQSTSSGGASTTAGTSSTDGGMGGSASTDSTTGASTSGGGMDDYNPDFEEFTGEDCNVGEPQDVNNPLLPDLFEFFDGSRMSSKSEWSCRRAEIKKVVETYIHGEKPGRPETVTGSVSNSSISVHVENGGKSIDFSVTVSIPGGASMPAPAIIGLGGSNLSGSILSEEGVATITYNHNTLANEGTRMGLFTDIYGNTGASAQIGWAWGVSRIIDVLVDERDAGRNDIIDPTAIGVTGCSRNGKGAFTVGAFDERIALGIPQESGTGGVSAFRIVNEAIRGPNGNPSQSLSSAWSEAQGWFGSVFSNYINNVNVIPGDTHSLVAMYAPRGLLVLDNSRIGELGSTAQHGATAAGAEVFKALGVEKNVAYNGGNPTDPHNHCTFYPDTQGEPLRRAIRAHLTRTAEPDGRMEPQPVATADLSEWIDWDTPTLQ